MIFDYSRYTFCERWIDADSRTFFDARRPYRFRSRPDNVQYLVKEGESLFTIAGRHFSPIERAAGLWWVIADYQPNPIHDPTVRLVPGTILVLPSHTTLQQEIFSPSRLQESRT